MACRVERSHCESMDMIKNHIFPFCFVIQELFFHLLFSDVKFFSSSKSPATEALSLALTLRLIPDDSFKKVEEVKIRLRTR